MHVRFVELVELWLFGVFCGAAGMRVLWAMTLGNWWDVTRKD